MVREVDMEEASCPRVGRERLIGEACAQARDQVQDVLLTWNT